MTDTTNTTNATWNNFWTALQVGAPVQQGSMQVFPLTHKLRPAVDYLTLEGGMTAGGGTDFLVEEVSSAGSVTELKVINRLSSPVLLVEGEILLGAKQNRTVHTTILVDEKSDVIIPVACVEQGRWSGVARKRFEVSEQFAHASLRYAKLRHVATARASAGTTARAAAGGSGRDDQRESYPVNQAAVWNHVSEFSNSSAVQSPTGSADDMYRQVKSKAESRPRFDYPRESSGIAVAIEGRLIGIECFDRPATMEKMFPRLIESYISESSMKDLGGKSRPAMKAGSGEAAEITPSTVTSFLQQVGGAKASAAPSVGLGEDLRAQAPDWSAAVLTCRGGSLHGQVFLSSDEPSRAVNGGEYM